MVKFFDEIIDEKIESKLDDKIYKTKIEVYEKLYQIDKDINEKIH